MFAIDFRYQLLHLYHEKCERQRELKRWRDYGRAVAKHYGLLSRRSHRYARGREHSHASVKSSWESVRYCDFPSALTGHGREDRSYAGPPVRKGGGRHQLVYRRMTRGRHMLKPEYRSLTKCISALLHSRYFLGSAVLLVAFASRADCVTDDAITTCTTAAPNPYVTRVGSGNIAAEDGRTVDVQAGAKLVVGDSSAISLRNNANVYVGTGATVSAAAVRTAGLYGTGGNTIEMRNGGTLTVDVGGEVLALGTQGSAEAINFQGTGNTIINSGTIRANSAVAIWSQNTAGLNTIVNTETGIIQAPGTVIGGSGNGALDFTNRGQVIGDVNLAGGDDILRLYTGSTITGNFSGGAGNDAIFLSGTGDSMLPGNFVGFESLTKNDSGKWTLSGTITGVTISTVDQGTLTLTGNNINYTGQVIVNTAGTLEAPAQSLPPTVTNNGLVRFVQTNGGTYSGAITGTGALEKTGVGGLTLSGPVSVDGATIVDGGIIVVASTLETAVVNMGAGTALKVDGILQRRGGGTADVIGIEGSQTVRVAGRLNGSAQLGDGDDLIDISGVITGSVDQGAGNDSAIIRPDGSIAGALTQGAGNDSLDWHDGGVVHGSIDFGEGDDLAKLTNLNASNLGTLPSFDGGLGIDTLSMSSVKTNGVSRFVGWEQVRLANDSQFSFDGNLTLGDSGTGTGALDIDATSVIFAGGLNAGIAPFTAGQLVSVTNAGRIDLSNGIKGAGDAFTIVGNYVGNRGTLYLQTVLGDDSSLSDRLIISKGSVSGTSGIAVLNLGGTGAATLADGIMVVQAVNGGSTAADAFALYSPVAAGAYEYYLFKGGVSVGSTENWYLRSTVPASVTPAPVSPSPIEGTPVVPGPPTKPPTPGARPAEGEIIPLYRVETPVYTLVPPLLRETSLISLGTFHERQGEQSLLAGQGGGRAAWARLIGQGHEQHREGDAQPGFEGDILGVQTGIDLYAANLSDNVRNQFGVFVGRTRAQGKVTGFAIGWENVAVGRTRLDDKYIGMYLTRVSSTGGYLDAVLMQSRYDGDTSSVRGLGIDVRGEGTIASLEAGKPLRHLGQSGWWLEPQTQVIWQRTSINEASDRVSPVRFNSDNAWTARVGLRLAADYDLAGNGWQPYLKLNYWQTFDGEDRIHFGANQLTNQQAARALEFGIGVVSRFNSSVSAFAVADYTRDLASREQRKRKVVDGTVGLRMDW